MRRRTSALKPSGYDVVIRNMLAMKRINARLPKIQDGERDALLTEKDRLIDEMQAACPHESVVRCPSARISLSPKPVEARLCTSCGLYELRAAVLVRRRGRRIVTHDLPTFSTKLGETLRRTGINAPSR